MMRLLQTVFSISATICIGGAIILFLRNNGERSRRILAWIMAVWGCAFLLRASLLVMEKRADLYSEVLPPWLILAGAAYAIVILVWPIEILRPGWLNAGRLFRLSLPFIATGAIYYAAIGIFGLRQFRLGSVDSFIGHLSCFSVWFRLVLCCATAFYVVYLLRLIHRFNRSYNAWCENNFSSIEHFDIGWLNGYCIGAVVIALAYFVNLVVASPLTMMIHNSIVGLFFGWVLLRSIKHTNPYPEGYFGVDQADSRGESVVAETTTFEHHLDAYKSEIEDWFAAEKPYLRPGFKLTDISAKIPLNRSYLSRIFNDGFGKSFNAFVNECRIGEAKRMMHETPGISIADIAERCGYPSVQAFHRAFVRHEEGLTPRQYQKSLPPGHEGVSI